MLKRCQKKNTMIHEILLKLKLKSTHVKDGDNKGQKKPQKRRKLLKLMELSFLKKIKKDWIDEELQKRRKKQNYKEIMKNIKAQNKKT